MAMPNTFAPFGFRAFGHQDGSPPTMGMSKFTMNSSYATAVFSGDLVKLSSTVPGTVELTTAALNTIVPLGIFQGCEYYNATVQRQVWSPYFPGSVGSALNGVTAYVITDPEMTYIAQCSTGSVVGSSMVGYNIGFTSTGAGGNTTNGLSGQALLSSAAGVSGASSYPWRIVDTYSNFAPPGTNGASTDSGGGILIVQPTGWMRNTVNLTGVTS